LQWQQEEMNPRLYSSRFSFFVGASKRKIISDIIQNNNLNLAQWKTEMNMNSYFRLNFYISNPSSKR